MTGTQGILLGIIFVWVASTASVFLMGLETALSNELIKISFVVINFLMAIPIAYFINYIRHGEEQKQERESLLYQIVQAIKEFKPARKLRDEHEYENVLYSWLKSRFPKIKVQAQIGSSRPDIVIRNIAIEIKGPTHGTDQLDSVGGKLFRYMQHFEKVIVVLFDVTVSERFYKEWSESLKKKFPDVVVIKKG